MQQGIAREQPVHRTQRPRGSRVRVGVGRSRAFFSEALPSFGMQVVLTCEEL